MSHLIETFCENSKKELTHVFRRDKITESLKKNSLRSLILSEKTSKKFLTNNEQ
ncbi:hypothetical protein CUZ89_2087 [Enterococcus xinjiangensis]|nr:hypothetical protein [Enterococcus lactis]